MRKTLTLICAVTATGLAACDRGYQPDAFCIGDSNSHLVLKNLSVRTWPANEEIYVWAYDEDKNRKGGTLTVLSPVPPNGEFVTKNAMPFRVVACTALPDVGGPDDFTIS